MKIELTMLLWSAVLCLVIVLAAGFGTTQQFGMAYVLSNREQARQGAGWLGRAQRAHRNMLENLLPFAAVVSVVMISGRSTSISALGAEVFFGARLVHALSYVAGVKGLRTLAYNVGTVGTFMVASAAF
jgi:uncharacterized MAPEG superfamily protein